MSHKNDKKKRHIVTGIILTVYVAVFLFVFLVFLEILPIDILVANIVLYVSIGVAIIGLSIWGIIYLLNKRKEKIIKEQKAAARQNRSSTRQQRASEQSHSSTGVRTRSLGKTAEKVNADALIFTGETDSQKCGICKLTCSLDQLLCICPFCESLFHKNHLEEWLSRDKDCPVCSRDLSGYITKE